MSTVTSILSTDLISNSRATINTNFGNLNATKVESSVLTSILGAYVQAASPVFTGTVTASVISASVVSVSTDVFTVGLTDYSGTSTIVGWASLSQTQILYRKVGHHVTVWFALSGTSNSTSTSFTLPLQCNGIAEMDFSISARDNGTAVGTGAVGQMFNGNATAIFSKDQNGTAWTNSGTKAIVGSFTYYTTQ